MGKLKVFMPALILAAGFAVCTSSVYGTPEYAKKEKKSCTFCHEKVMSEKAEMAKNLKPMGKCYKEHDHSLAKCEVEKK
jgi:hypothetical protein